MQRSCMAFLKEWLNDEDRRPLVIRGARQVGKTWIVRQLAKQENKQLVEINLEEKPGLASAFESNDPEIILRKLRGRLEVPTNPDKIILFLDEIQAAPKLFAKLRWFAEKMPQLPVIAAGSLLEFVLGQYEMSMPVGRISYMYLEPFSFEEFLQAQERPFLIEAIKMFTWDDGMDQGIHAKLMDLVKEYIIVGGMPTAVSSWVRRKSLEKVSQEHANIVQTYADDFGKYSRRIAPDLLRKVLAAVPRSLAEKFVFRRVDDDASTPHIKEALRLLCQARVCHVVQGVAANGVPLAGETYPRIKVVFLDSGLCSASLKLSLTDLETVKEIDLVNKGGIAEQVVGQLLRTIFRCYESPGLYYWQSYKAGGNAEIDYVIQHRTSVVPIEVKAGTTGSLKSLHRFMHLKGLPLAVRINSGVPSRVQVDMKDTQGNRVNYELRSLPFYLIGELHRLLN